MATKTQDDAPAEPAKPDFQLVVVHPFGDYRRGDSITDPDAVATVMASENAHHCHKVFPQ